MASSSRTTLQPLSGEQQENLIKQRMQVDERSLRRLVKKLTLLLASRDSESISSSRLSFKADLESFQLQLLRLSSIARSTCETEIKSYSEELSEIELEQRKTHDRIESLKRKLGDVRRERKNKLEYDVVAGEIVKLPTRQELEESLGRLREQLEGVREEREKYAELAKGAGGRMGTVIEGLEGLRNDVGYEVGERERREVERADADGDAENAEAGTGATGDDGASEAGKGRRSRKESGEEPEEGEEHEEGESAAISREGSSTPRTSTRAVTEEAASASLNPSAPTFKPSSAAGRRKRDSTAVTASDEEGEVGDGSSAAAASSTNTPRKRQRTEEGEVGSGAGGESEEEEGSIRPSAAPETGSRGARAGTKRRR